MELTTTVYLKRQSLNITQKNMFSKLKSQITELKNTKAKHYQDPISIFVQSHFGSLRFYQNGSSQIPSQNSGYLTYPLSGAEHGPISVKEAFLTVLIIFLN